MVSFLIAYASWSGNTQEVAEIIEETMMESENVDVTTYRIGGGIIPNPRNYDAMIIGSFTWDQGATPDEVKDFVADVGYKPEQCLRLRNGGHAIRRGCIILQCRSEIGTVL